MQKACVLAGKEKSNKDMQINGWMQNIHFLFGNKYIGNNKEVCVLSLDMSIHGHKIIGKFFTGTFGC